VLFQPRQSCTAAAGGLFRSNVFHKRCVISPATFTIHYYLEYFWNSDAGVQAGPPSSFYDASETFYNRLDADQDGRLSVDELVAGAKASWNTTLSDENTMRILELLDADGDGAITRSEFMERIGTAVSEGGVGNVWVGCDWDDDACYDDKCSQFDACWFTCSLEDGPCN